MSFATPLSAQPEESASEPKLGTVLRTLSAGLAMSETELQKLYLIDLEATVTFNYGGFFYIHDGISGIFVEAHGISEEELTGKRLRVQGSLFKGNYMNQVRLSGYEVLGAGRLPVGQLQAFDQLMEGIFDSQWVAIEAVVDEVETTEDQLWAKLVMEGGRCDLQLVPLLSSGDLASVKRGTLLRVEGVSAVRTADGKSVASLHMYAPGFDQLKILNAQTDTLFQEPLTPTGQLSLNLGNRITDRVNVKGTYIGSLPDHSIVIQDGDSSVVVRSNQEEGFAMGDILIANGRASTSDPHPSLLETAIIDKTGEGEISPTLLSRDQLSEPLVHDRLVRIQGLYKGRIAMARDVRFRVEVDGAEVLAHLPERETELSDEIRSLSFNSEIEVTGICQNLTDPDGLPSLVIENSESIKFIAPPRPWRYRTVAFVILGFVFLTGSAVGWLHLIRSQFLLSPAAAPAAKTRAEDVDDHLHQILENDHDFIFTCDLNGDFISINSAGGSVLGYEESEWKAMNWKQLVDPDQPNQFQGIRWVTESEKPIEVILKKRSGAPICFEVNARFLTKKGKPHAIHAIARDITERVRYEKELIKAKQSAEEATQEKSEFLAGISREIRTSVNGIIGMTDLVLSSPLPTEEKRLTSIARQSAKNLLVILNDLLDYPQVEVGKLELAKDEFSLRKELDQAMSAMGISAHEKNLELILNVAPDTPDRLLGDPHRLQQVLINLISNAVKFTTKGEILVFVAPEEDEIDLESHPDAEDQVGIRFEIEDTGSGVSEKQKQHIFAALSGNSTDIQKSSYGGQGLTISERIVRLMNGNLWLDTVPDRGSVFSFNVFLRSPDPKDFGPLPPLPQGNLYTHALVVDSNTNTAALLRGAIKSWGMSCSVAKDVVAAREILSEESINLMLISESVGGICGIEFAHEIKEQLGGRVTPVVMLRTHNAPNSIKQCREAGIKHSLFKPISITELRTLFGAVLSDKPPIPSQTKAPIEESIPADWITRSPSNPQPSKSNSPHYHVLLAEDNLVNQKVASAMLRKAGYEVVIANNGQIALAKLENQFFDFILMDVQMPIMDGLEAAREIRKREHKSGDHIPIIALTAHATEVHQDSCFAAGMDDYIAKPFQMPRLFQSIDRLLKPKRTRPYEVE